MTTTNGTIDEFDAPLTGRRVRIFYDESTPSGKNWEYVGGGDR